MANIGYIQVNRYCNNQCHFCSNPSNGSNITYERWVELIDDFVNRWYKWIIFTWWEPTLTPDLSRWIQYSNKKWMYNRIISNWMQCSNFEYTKKLKDSWLELIHFSVYSCYAKIHDFLTDTPWSWDKLMKSITNALKLWIRVQINTVINHYNQEHLDKTVKFLIKHFPQIRHIVWNNLDPLMMRKTDIAIKTLPDFKIFSPYLIEAMRFLESTNRTFRAERVPLCFMRWYERASTETRKIVKEEERIVYFLDNREMVQQSWKHWGHYKSEWCKKCDLDGICSGIYEFEKFFNYVEVIPQKLSKNEKEQIIKMINL
jgi:MoaA/NifB/PqqE/SkfB family radical SAM enzyme